MWQRSISKLVTGTALLGVFAATVLPAHAATFAVNPIMVVLHKGNSSAAVAVTNQSPDKLRLQVSGFAWQQKPDGEMQLTASNDLVFFPQLVTLAPGETRRIRIGITADPGPDEKAFRVFMEELPSLESVVAPKKVNTVTIRMRIGIPVFLSATGAPVVSGAVRNAAVREGSLSFDVLNTGNTHFSIQKVNVVGKSAAGDVLKRELSGWYVLPGGTRRFAVPIGKGQCAELKSIAVAVHTDAVSFSNSFTDPNKQCGSVSAR